MQETPVASKSNIHGLGPGRIHKNTLSRSGVLGPLIIPAQAYRDVTIWSDVSSSVINFFFFAHSLFSKWYRVPFRLEILTGSLSF